MRCACWTSCYGMGRGRMNSSKAGTLGIALNSANAGAAEQIRIGAQPGTALPQRRHAGPDVALSAGGIASIGQFPVSVRVNQALRVRSYRSTLSSTQIPPDTSAIVSTSLSWSRESSTGGIHRGIIKPFLPNVETRNGSPIRFPSVGSK